MHTRIGPLLASRVHRNAGPTAFHNRRLLANGVGAERSRDSDAHAACRSGKGMPLFIYFIISTINKQKIVFKYSNTRIIWFFELSHKTVKYQ